MRNNPLLRRVIKVSLWLSSVILIVFAWNIYLLLPPTDPVPLPAIPSNNAYDTFIEIGQHLEDLPVGISNERKWEDRVYINDKNFSDDQSGLRKVIDQYGKYLFDIRKGIKQQYMFPIRDEDSIRDIDKRMEISYNARVRCESLLMADITLKNKLCQWRSAFVSADVLLSYYFVTQSRHWSRAVPIVRDVAKGMTAQETRACISNLENTVSKQESFAEYIEQERPFLLYFTKRILNDPGKWKLDNAFRGSYAGAAYHPSPLENRGYWANQYYAWTVPDRSVIRIMDRYLRECEAAARQPFSAHSPFPSPPNDTYNYRQFRWQEWDVKYLQHAFGEFSLRCTLLEVALHGYYKEHKQFPSSLRDLTGDKWLKSIPIDPFVLNREISYKRTGNSYLLYSLGPDGIDNGGNPIKDIEPEWKWENVVRTNSFGDVVFDVNTRTQEIPARL